MQAAIIYGLAIVGAEVVTALVQTLWGIAFHITILVAVILHSALAREMPSRNRQLILSLALIPLVRIISLSMPLASLPRLLWFPIIYVPLAIAAVVLMRIIGYRAGDIGLRFRFALPQSIVALTGVGFGVVEYFILRPEAMVTELSLPQVLLPAVTMLLTTGFVEELIFRGVLQRTAVEALGRWGVVYISFLFAFLHIGYLSWVDVAFVFGVALFFGEVVKRTGSLVGVTLSHGLTNILLYLIVPFFFYPTI